MEKTDFRNPSIIQTISKNYVPVLLDIDSNTKIALQYKIKSLPTIFILDSSRNVVKVIEGYFPPQQLITFLNGVKQKPINASQTSDVLLNKSFFENLKRRQLELYSQTENHVWGTDQNIKFLDRNSIEYAMTLGATGNKIAADWARETLETQFSLLDPIWGGMYYYSTQGDWLHPNYEKPMTVQAENMRIYSQAYQYWQNSSYLLGAEKIANYIQNFLTSPEGAFYAGQSAFMLSGKQDADYYKLNDEQRREKGIPPVNKNIFPNENGLAINSFLFLYMVTEDEIYFTKARRAMEWIVLNLSLPDGGFLHSKGNNEIYLNDNLSMTRALLTFYKVTMDKKYLNHAEQTMLFINKNFRSKTNQPGFVSSNTSEKRNADDNGMLARVANLLFYYTENSTFKDMAKNAFNYLVSDKVIKNNYPALILIVHRVMTEPPLEISVIGSRQDPIAEELYKAALKYPSFYVKLEWLDKNNIKYPASEKPVAYVCVNKHCSLPIFKSNDLAGIIKQLTIHPETIKPIEVMKKNKTYENTSTKTATLLEHKNLFFIALSFWVFGFLLAFTPCVLPLILILTALLSGRSQDISHTKVKNLLQRFSLIRIDLTEITNAKKDMLSHYKIIAPPATVFFNPEGKEIKERIYDDITPENFAIFLQQILDENQ